MVMREVEYNGRKTLLVYLKADEKGNLEAALENGNRKFDAMVSFVSGNGEMKPALKQIIQNHAFVRREGMV